VLEHEGNESISECPTADPHTTLYHHFRNLLGPYITQDIKSLHLSLLEHEALIIPPRTSMVRSIQSSGEAGDHAGDHGLGPALCTVKPEMKIDFFCHGCRPS
jgi:hypothetical protein